jgi:hypothetical protein
MLLFLFNVLEGRGGQLRNVLLLTVFSTLASSFTYPLVPAGLVMILTVIYTIVERNKKQILVRFAYVLASLAMTFVLIAPYSFFILWELLHSPTASVLSSISAKYKLESVIAGMRSVYATSTPINLIRILYLTYVPNWWYGGSASWNILGFALPLLSFSCLLFMKHRTRSKHIVTLASVAVFTILFTWMTYLSYTLPLFFGFPFLFVYDAPEYLMWYVIVAYAPLIAITIDELKQRLANQRPLQLISKNEDWLVIRLNKRGFKRVTALSLVLLLGISSIVGYAWPFFTGDMAMPLLSEAGFQIPKEGYNVTPVLYQMASWLNNHEKNSWSFRVTVLPFNWQVHYGGGVLGANVMPPPPNVVDALVKGQTDHIGSLLGFFNIKYVFVNLATFDVAATGTGWNKKDFVNCLNSQRDLKLIENNTDFLVYRNEDFVPLISVSNNAFYLKSLNQPLPPQDKIIMLAVMPAFNMTRQLFFFGDDSSAEEDWVLNKTDTLIFFGDNASIADQYISRAGSELSNVVYLFKLGERPQNMSVASFDGKTGYIEVPSSPSLDATFTAMTIAAWICPFPYSGARAIYSNPTPAYSGGFRWQLVDRWYTPVGPVPPLDGTIPPPPLNEWTLVTAVFNGTHLLNYQDTTLTDSSIAGASSFNMSGTNYIGAYLGQTNFFNGFMTNFQIYNKALNLTQIKQLYEDGVTAKPILNAGLVGWWALNQSSGTIAYDLSGNGNHGALRGGVSWSSLGTVRQYDPEASLGYGRKIYGGEREIINFHAPQNGSYNIALRARASGSIGIVLTVDGKLAIRFPTSDQDNNFHWYDTHVPLSKGLHTIEMSTYEGRIFLDELVLFYSIPQPDLTLNEIFTSPNQVSYASREISWTDYVLDFTSEGPSFIALWQAFHPDWSAYTDNVKLYHFNTSLWANGFYLNKTGSNHVEIHFEGQNIRNVVLFIWAIGWIMVMGIVIYTSRREVAYMIRRMRRFLEMARRALEYGA